VGGNIWQFRINPDDLIMANAFAGLMAEQASKISLIGENTDFGRGALAAYKPLLEAMDVEIVSEDYFDLGTADFRPGLTAIRAADPEAVLIVMTERDGSTFMRQYREVGIEAAVFSRGSLTSPLFLEFTEDDPTIGEGILEYSFWAFGIDPEHDEAFFERFDTPNSPHRAMSYYAVRYVIAEAIRNTIANNDGEITREGIRDELAALDIETPIGPIKFDDHNQAYPFGTIQTIQDGETTFLETVELVPVEREME
jgi:branched-chain amino acid transport system substrate-binding protein